MAGALAGHAVGRRDVVRDAYDLAVEHDLLAERNEWELIGSTNASTSSTNGSDSSAQKRRRRRRALARKLDVSLLGPDRSEIVHRFDDGWTVRRIPGLADQRREGILCRSCMRSATKPYQNALSLRDPDNLPHISFTGFQVQDSPLEPMMREVGGLIGEQFVFGKEVFFHASLLHPEGSKVHLARVHEFAEAHPGSFPLLPSHPQHAAIVLSRRVLLPQTKRPGPAYEECLRRIERETDLAETIWDSPESREAEEWCRKADEAEARFRIGDLVSKLIAGGSPLFESV